LKESGLWLQTAKFSAAADLAWEFGRGLGETVSGRMNWTADEKLTGNPAVIEGNRGGRGPGCNWTEDPAGLLRFLEHRKNYLLY